MRLQHVGGAAQALLQSGINDTDMSFTVQSGQGSSYPDGAGFDGFVICLDMGQAGEEKVLCSARSGDSFTIEERGWDDTNAVAHDPGASVNHTISAVEMDEANALVEQTTGLVTTKGDLTPATGSGALGRLAAGSNGLPLVAKSGETTGLAYEALSATGLASNAVTTAKILDANVTTAKIADSQITSAKIVDGTIATGDIADAAVTAAKIAAAVAGNGLAGGAGTALSVGVDDSTIEINSDALRVKDGGITSAKIANGTIATADLADGAVTAAKTDGSIGTPRWFVGPFSGENLTGSGPLYGGVLIHAVMMESGSILGISVRLSAARVSGSATFEVQKNGSGTGVLVTIDGTNTQQHYFTQARGTDTFVAGDRLTVSVLNTSFSPDTADYAASILCSL